MKDSKSNYMALIGLLVGALLAGAGWAITSGGETSGIVVKISENRGKIDRLEDKFDRLLTAQNALLVQQSIILTKIEQVILPK